MPIAVVAMSSHGGLVSSCGMEATIGSIEHMAYVIDVYTSSGVEIATIKVRRRANPVSVWRRVC